MFKLKSKLIIAVVTLFSITAFVSCQKEDNKLKEEFTVDIASSARDVGVGIKIKGKPYRAIESRPRDGKNCGCKVCFGVCELSMELDFDFSKMFMVVDPNGNTTRIHILENLENFEPEFGIDDDIFVPSKALNGTGMESLTLLKGIYDFIEMEDKINIDGKEQVTYGYVDVISEIK